MTIKLRPYSETIKENMSKEELIEWITELEPCVQEVRSLRAARDKMWPVFKLANDLFAAGEIGDDVRHMTVYGQLHDAVKEANK